MAEFAQALALTLKHEGGYVNDPLDPGGATNLGVTLRTWQAFNRRPATVDEIKALTVDDVTPLYKLEYWDTLSLDTCENQRYAESLFDYCVNAGVHAAMKADAAANGDLTALLQAKLGHYQAIVDARPTSAKFLPGWTKRAESYSA